MITIVVDRPFTNWLSQSPDRMMAIDFLDLHDNLAVA
jgi:hypothetical protein